MELVERHENVLVARTLSKSYSLAGLRVGYAVAQEPLIKGMCKVKDSYNVDSVALAGAAAAIRGPGVAAPQTSSASRQRAKRMTAALEALGFRCIAVAGELRVRMSPKGHRSGHGVQTSFRAQGAWWRYFNLPRRGATGWRISVGSEEEDRRAARRAGADTGVREDIGRNAMTKKSSPQRRRRTHHARDLRSTSS